MKRFLSILLAILMLAVMLPVSAMAEDGDPTRVNGVWQNVTPTNVQDVLDGKYGSIDNSTIVLTAGTYGRLELGRATKHPGSNTTYTCPHNDPTITGGGPVSFTKVEDYIAHMTNNPHHGDARTFTRTMSNLTITAQEEADVTVKGLTLLARTYRDAKDPFVNSTEKDYIGYDIDLVVNDLAFSNIKFTGKVEIASENRDNTIIDGVTFENCKFETNDITTINGQAINFSNNVNNGQVKNLIVKNCDFTNCYQGVYTNQVRDVSVTGCTFNTTGHNAIAIQDSGACNHGNVVIIGNTFKDIGDRIIRFNSPAAETVITITKNTAVNSGKTDKNDGKKEIIAAVDLPESVSVTMAGNKWGENTKFGKGFENVVDEPIPEPSTPIVIVPDRTEDTPKTDDQKNPATGANDMVAAAVAFMAVSALGAAVLTRKK